MANRSLKRQYSETKVYVKLQWSSSKRKTKRKLGSAQTKTKHLQLTIQDRWSSLVLLQLHRRHKSSLKLASPVPHLHTCNDTPSDEEHTLVALALEDAERVRTMYKQDMERRAVWELVRNKTQPIPPEIHHIDKFVNGLKTVSSPLRRLPTELLQEIFMRASNDLRTFFPTSYRSSAAADLPWTLGRVCKRWRDVCLATPSLWNYFPALMMKSAQLPGEKRRERERFRLMIERSGDTELHISISGFGVDLTTHPIIEMLVAVSDRWETAILDMTLMTFPALNPIKNRLGRLKCLRLWLWYSFIPPRHDIQWDMFADAPSLLNVDLYSTSFSQELVLPYSQLHYLFVDSGSLALLDLPKAVEVFSQNNAPLQSLSLNMSFDSPFFLPIVFPQLKRLKLTFYSTGVPITLEHITLPVLEELIVACDCEVMLPVISSLLRRSAAANQGIFPLQKLYLQMEVATAEMLIPIVDLIPRLHTLETPLGMETIEFVNRLADGRSDAVIAPELEYCSFKSDFHDPRLYEAVNKLGRVRCCGVPAEEEEEEDEREVGKVEGGSGDIVHMLKEMDITEGAGSIRLFKRLKALTLQCKRFEALTHHQRLLEDTEWTGKGTIETLMEKVSEVVSATNGYGVGSIHGAHVSGKVTREVAVGILEELRKCKIGEVDVRDIYVPQVHLQLQALDKWIGSNSCKVKWKGAAGILKELQTAIQDTLESWYFAFDEYTPNVHWAAISQSTLMYIPSDDPFRSSSNAVELMRVHTANSHLNPFYEVFNKGACSDDL